MSFDFDKVFGIHQQAVLLRSKRAEVIAGNLANADTPGYKARDVDFKSLLTQARDASGATALSTTRANHMTLSGQTANADSIPMGDLLYRNPLQPSLDGNTVDSQVEKSEFMQNAVQYQASLSFLDGKIKTLKKALKGE